MKLSVVVPVLGQHALAHLCIAHLILNRYSESTEIIVVDNGGDFEMTEEEVSEITVLRPEKNLGVYPVFPWAMNRTDADIVLFIHSDLIIVERDFDERILATFKNDPKLGLLGFVGSNEIDSSGGRGVGTTSNFQGRTYYGAEIWKGSPAGAHGKTNAGLTNAAVVDGCAMALRRTAKIDFRENFPPHHFYDRLIATQMLEAGYRVAVLGIACDHISGQTVSKESRYGGLAEEWSRAHLSPDKFVGNPPDYSWDQTVYQEAERQWLSEYRDIKKLIPIKV